MEPFGLEHDADASHDEAPVTFGPAIVAIVAAAMAGFVLASGFKPASPDAQVPRQRG
jgi:hypothetical protein